MLTLITATLDAARFLERAIASAAQAGPHQHIVVDGGSRDDTLAICARYPNIEAVSEPGSSIYEAWNIGITRARGDAVMFLNADDELMPETAPTIAQTLRDYPHAELVAGRAAVVDDDAPNAATVMLRAAAGGELDVAQLAAGVPAINAIAFRPSVFGRHGKFETCYRVAGDRAFLLRLALERSPVAVASVDTLLYRYHIHAGSLTLKRGLKQRLRIARDHLALSRALLREDLPDSAALWLRHMRRREASVATLRCLAAGHVGEALGFVPSIFR